MRIDVPIGRLTFDEVYTSRPNSKSFASEPEDSEAQDLFANVSGSTIKSMIEIFTTIAQELMTPEDEFSSIEDEVLDNVWNL